MNVLRFVPFETVVDTAFWHGLAKRKLNDYCLSEGPFELTAEFSNGHAAGVNSRLTVDLTSFVDSDVNRTLKTGSFKLNGQMWLFNSLDHFKTLDKQLFINSCGSKLLQNALLDNGFLKDPDLINIFQLITYCDLKNHKFYFWFAFPAVLHPIQPTLISTKRLEEEFSEKEMAQLLCSYDAWKKSHPSPFFVVQMKSEAVSVLSFATFIISPSVYIGLCDSSVDPQYPCWILRNMLYLISASLIKIKQRVKVICLRDRYIHQERQVNHSLVLELELHPVDPITFTQFVGWEKWKNQLIPRILDLSESMDPKKLAESAVDLNLRLMKWRLMPNMKLSLFRDTKCLLIGAGTLGCNVARQLLAWGVRYITLIDNGSVSPSNPVRQSLFVFADAISNGRCKAFAAADALKTIFPGVCAKGVQLTVPMPGHPVVDSNVCINSATLTENKPYDAVTAMQDSCIELENLIRAHDVLFLLTDTRESRWLPTVLANVHGKLVINAALGFDTYLVMRHGVRAPGLSPSFEEVDDISKRLNLLNSDFQNKPTNQNNQTAFKAIPGNKLGCYFCNDVVAPMNSTQNRSLDQQCTVTRPGVSMIAAALAVELMISIMQHPLMYAAPAVVYDYQDLPQFDINTDDTLGIIPHQIRGFLFDFSQILPATTAFSHCSACSQSVLDKYKEDGFNFLLRVFNDSTYLEQICGLRDLHHDLADEIIFDISE